MSTGEWIGLICTLLVQGGAIVAFLWRLSERLTRIESRIETAVDKEIERLCERVTRLERRIFPELEPIGSDDGVWARMHSEPRTDLPS